MPAPESRVGARVSRRRPMSRTARKLICCSVPIVLLGGFLILSILLLLTFVDMPAFLRVSSNSRGFLASVSASAWADDAKEGMITFEHANLITLATGKAEYVTEAWRTAEVAMLQLQAFAEQTLVAVSDNVFVEDYLESYAGLEQETSTWEHSVWYMPDYGIGQHPLNTSSQEYLLKRCSLLDVHFRAKQRQHLLMYVAVLDDPDTTGVNTTDINMQIYDAFDLEEAGYLEYTPENGCDSRFTEYGSIYTPSGYDPRCASWYQDAIEDVNEGVVFSGPYIDRGTSKLVLTVAAPVYGDTSFVGDASFANTSNDNTSTFDASSDLSSDISSDPRQKESSHGVLGVAGIDVDLSDVEGMVVQRPVAASEGYSYLLIPEGHGAVAMHPNMSTFDGTENIIDVEGGLNETEFSEILTNINEIGTGVATFTREGRTWLLSWNNPYADGSVVRRYTLATDGGTDGLGEFISVTTVPESAILKPFAETDRELWMMSLFVSLATGVMLVAIAIFTIIFAWTLADNMFQPLVNLKRVITALRVYDFSRQPAGTWAVGSTSCPEIEDLLMSFQAMTTVIKFKGVHLNTGNVDVAEQIYADALVVFEKSGNNGGVSIVHNNLGNIYTLQAKKYAGRAAEAKNKVTAGKLLERADAKYGDAVTSFELAIEDAAMRCSGHAKKAISPTRSRSIDGEYKEESKARLTRKCHHTDVEEGDVGAINTENDIENDLALTLKLFTRKYNLALCLLARGNSAVPTGGRPDIPILQKARRLMWECVGLAADMNGADGDQRLVSCLLEIVTLECTLPGREKQAGEALDEAERVIIAYRDVGGVADGIADWRREADEASLEGTPLSAPLGVLRQRLLAARGMHCVAKGEPMAAIPQWTDAILGCGERMDANAVRSSLEGLRKQAEDGLGHCFPEELLMSLGLLDRKGRAAPPDTQKLVAAINAGLAKVEIEAVKGTGMGKLRSEPTDVDLCIVMDCTSSMQTWIDKMNEKFMQGIEQMKREMPHVNLRISFIGYRDHGDAVRFEGPYNFHAEDDLPSLLAKLDGIRAFGDRDTPDDITGGLHHALALSWKSPIRLLMLITDAPCHGATYNDCFDLYAKGCPSGRDPSKLLYSLQYELGVDFYFVRIKTVTDKMINVLQKTIAFYANNRKNGKQPVLRGSKNTAPKFLVHNVGENYNRFMESVVQSVKISTGYADHVEIY